MDYYGNEYWEEKSALGSDTQSHISSEDEAFLYSFIHHKEASEEDIDISKFGTNGTGNSSSYSISRRSKVSRWDAVKSITGSANEKYNVGVMRHSSVNSSNCRESRGINKRNVPRAVKDLYRTQNTRNFKVQNLERASDNTNSDVECSEIHNGMDGELKLHNLVSIAVNTKERHKSPGFKRHSHAHKVRELDIRSVLETLSLPTSEPILNNLTKSSDSKSKTGMCNNTLPCSSTYLTDQEILTREVALIHNVHTVECGMSSQQTKISCSCSKMIIGRKENCGISNENCDDISKYSLSLPKNGQSSFTETDCDINVIDIASESDNSSITEIHAPPKPPPLVVELDSSDEHSVSNYNITGEHSSQTGIAVGMVINYSKERIYSNEGNHPLLVSEDEIGKKRKTVRKRKHKSKKQKISALTPYAVTSDCLNWTPEMVRFYNHPSGEKNFELENIRRTMSGHPRHWKIIDADRYAPLKRSGPQARIRCHNCNQLGHMAMRCPEPTKVWSCYMCGEKGHREPRCPNKICLKCGRSSSLYTMGCSFCSAPGSDPYYCTTCGQSGHYVYQCPTAWRGFHNVTSPDDLSQFSNTVKYKPSKKLYCSNCAQRGHQSHDCFKHKRQNPCPPVPWPETSGAQKLAFGSAGVSFPLPFYNVSAKPSMKQKKAKNKRRKQNKRERKILQEVFGIRQKRWERRQKQKKQMNAQHSLS